MNRSLAILVVATLVGIAPAASAVSDGNYNPAKQHCTKRADLHTEEKKAEKGCHNSTVVIYDSSGHEYVVAGTLQTPEGESVHAMDVCVDPGQGTKYCALVDMNGGSKYETVKGTPASPASGLHFYFGADDNLDTGEHDSSPQWANGPSDGGGIQLNEEPDSVTNWLYAVQYQDKGYLLTHPIPLFDAGVGACADGLCFSLQTQQRTVFQGGDSSKHRDAANYDGKKWDPDSCAGPSDSSKDCGGKKLKSYNDDEGSVYAEPGIQIYEDPDAQGSPEGPSYPIPSAYVGTCGIVFGGGRVADQSTDAPPSPVTNHSGQIVVSTGC
ncbi:MAG: hypothetical protein ABR579_09150 [Actinomycetota bacterium]